MDDDRDSGTLASNSGRFSVLRASVCSNSGDGVEAKKMTNRDKFLLKLIDMSDRELANIYCLYVNDCRDCHFVGVKGCFDKLVEWIKQERKENDDRRS